MPGAGSSIIVMISIAIAVFKIFQASDVTVNRSLMFLE